MHADGIGIYTTTKKKTMLDKVASWKDFVNENHSVGLYLHFVLSLVKIPFIAPIFRINAGRQSFISFIL